MGNFPKPLRHCSLSDLVNRSEELAVRQSQGQRKISLGLLEEAFQLSQSIGLTEAAKLAGLNKNSLKHYRTIRLRELGQSGKRGGILRVTQEQKYKVFEIQSRLYLRGYGSKRKCWIEAGRRVGVSGRTVEFQYVRGLWIP